jgi:hypothetical protein
MSSNDDKLTLINKKFAKNGVNFDSGEIFKLGSHNTVKWQLFGIANNQRTELGKFEFKLDALISIGLV